MPGYYIYSLDADAFRTLTTAPTKEQSLVLADSIIDDLGGLLDEGGETDAADPSKWPFDREALAERIRKRLASPDWYADLRMGDAAIWDNLLYNLSDEPGEKLGVDFQCENDGFLYWDAADIAAQHGAPMMAEQRFGNSGFRYSGKSRGDIELMYTFYLPAQTQRLLKQLEKAVAYFETLPDEKDGDRDQFFQGLLEPVRRIVAAVRVMWVQTDT
ncbi:MAG: hypothetical protein GX575_25005 [Candidatus Anammoximicrobium sp.]|nr:hypothetical protein [Candidatus Anammoximicrobium sp.]